MFLAKLCGLLLLSGCAEVVKQDERPEWIDKPEPNFVGKCAGEAKDLVTQEQCAYNKALADISLLKSGFDDIEASGIIVDRWHDRDGDILYVLIREK